MLSKLDFTHFSKKRSHTLKSLWNRRFTFLISPKITEMEKVFAKKLGFLPYKENQVINFG